MTAAAIRPNATVDAAADVSDAVREAIGTRRPLRIVGAGTWLDAGRPVRAAARTLGLRTLAGIVDYTPGNLTLTARSGTTLAEIETATNAHGQWLALDPPGAAAATVGATIATASAGPLAHAFGRARDAILGIEAVTGEGSIVRSGGRVVKNVAGFDLTRLLTGAWGTLGVLTEVTVRLRARPERDETMALAVARAPRPLASWLGDPPVDVASAVAMELVNAALARHLGLASDGPVVLLRLMGNADLVGADRAALAGAGAIGVPDAVWDRLRTAEPPDAAVLRLSGPPARIADTWARATRLLDAVPRALVHASIDRGVVRCIVPDPDPVALGSGILQQPVAGTLVPERLPATLWGSIGARTGRDRLSRGVRRAFDPHGILNPGILGDGDAG